MQRDRHSGYANLTMRRRGPQELALSFLLSAALLAPCAAAGDAIAPSTPLASNDTLISAAGTFALGFFSPPGSNYSYVGVWYNTIPVTTVVWVANRASPLINGAAASLALTVNGTLTITDGSSTVLWSASSSVSFADPVAQLLDTGNLVIKDAAASGAVGWQSFDHPTDTLLPEMKIGVSLRSGLNRNLTAWKSSSDPSPTDAVAAMALAGYPELFIYSGGQAVWRSGPWDGVQFSGVQDTSAGQAFSFSFTDDGDEVAYGYNSSVVSRVVLNATGAGPQLQRWVWLASGGGWINYYYAPKDPCDALSACGPYGLCNANVLPVCSCLQGFSPKNPTNWELRDGKDGCVRNTSLDCSGGGDGFATVSHVKLPDTTHSVLDGSLGLDDCRAACLKNCNCTGYAAPSVSQGGGGGCIMWMAELTDIRVYSDAGQDLFVRLNRADIGTPPSAPATAPTTSHGAPAALIGSLCAVAVLLLGGAAFLFVRRRRKRAKGQQATGRKNASGSNDIDARNRGDDSDLPLLDLEVIAAATGGFDAANKLGEGGFGPVFKGKLESGQEIAVKCLAKTSLQGAEEFRNEAVLIAKLQHRNLVRLLGCCAHGEERMLVYEYMENTSLDAYLFDKTKSVQLDWRRRYQIILGIARGLLYLHQDSRLRIIHRDLKASNILLDGEMNPKISDFGMARIFGGEETQINTRKVVGTYGYMSPEYAMDGVFSMKSDVFSFGVLVLEIISGQRNRGGPIGSTDHQNLLEHAWVLWNEGNILQLVEESLQGRFPGEEALKCMKLGLLCVQEHPEDRPLMSAVILMLGGDSISLPSPKRPGFYNRRAPQQQGQESTSSSSRLAEASVADNLTITVLEGR